MVQVRRVVPELVVHPAVGGVISWVIVTMEDAVHPLAPVAVAVYKTGVVTTSEPDPEPPAVHSCDTPPVGIRVMLVCAQVNSVVPLTLVMPAVGGVMSCVTTMLSWSIQPLAPSTVTV